jgi:phosphoglycolate phosphatase
MKYKFVIFDFDGTLADSFPWAVGIADDLADKHRFKRIDDREREMLRGYSAGQILKYLRVRWWKMPFIAKDVRTAMARDIDMITLFDGVDQLFQGLASQGVVLAMVSSNSEKNIRHVLGAKNCALVKYFECGVSLFGKTPKINKLLKQTKIAPSETILIGDEIRDGQAARKAGIAFGAVAWGYTRVDALRAQAPTALFNAMHDIAQEIGRAEIAPDAI